jgi:hypothetical protein
MNDSQKPRTTIPRHVIALAGLAGVAALLAYALNNRPAERAAMPERPQTAASPRIDLDEAWATAAQQKVLGIGRLTANDSRVGATGSSFSAPYGGEPTVGERPVTRTVTHVGVSPPRREAPRLMARDAQPGYAAPSLANLPPPGD